ncbi:MAG TPA: hypothetical protein VNL92_03440, partial [Dehalococcoidia bacterium]|nr:hypothetical protein [Dehalococcoidia bacterium]
MVNTFDVALKSEGDGFETPCLLLDFDRLRANASLVRTTFTPLQPSIFYSVKANSHPSVLRVLSEEGLGFDVASIGEIMALVELGVPADRMIFSST